jgi:hypothetical protein
MDYKSRQNKGARLLKSTINSRPRQQTVLTTRFHKRLTGGEMGFSPDYETDIPIHLLWKEVVYIFTDHFTK